ncbi:AbrB/MazE/SpoVT family DNA-binding domain-containing protein [Xenorhabdus bovienii]|uniref:AbrB/MazE/SpoVT family DNA-binding domain-containing protein n=1 Tax=Xenorhabdus bovienii TaxID=40576 RepID=UPI0023B316B0|nr:AbrB/MazE/SpoVT family DNA-binding domain-containing protein [Xenorhabdus bovienii]MDE9544151.1 AbrB/MazE/SpoVT family DNA-binding domain-containing protein [Xenorhabdus bovienii]
MVFLSVTTKGQITLKRDLLQHLGVKAGEQINLEKLPDGEIRISAAHPTDNIDNLFGILAGKTKKIATVEEINEAIASGWSGDK